MADDVLSRSAPDTRYIVIHETVLQSWAKDAGTLAMFAGMTAFAEFALGGSVWAYASAGVLFGDCVVDKPGQNCHIPYRRNGEYRCPS